MLSYETIMQPAGFFSLIGGYFQSVATPPTVTVFWCDCGCWRSVLRICALHYVLCYLSPPPVAVGLTDDDR